MERSVRRRRSATPGSRGDVLGSGQVSGGDLVGLAHVHHDGALVDQLAHLGRVDLFDLALYLAEKLWA